MPGFYWRNNTGVAFYGDAEAQGVIQGKTPRRVRFGFVGSADFLGIGPGGVFVAIEAKRAGRTLSPEQILFRDQILKHGGVFIEAHDANDVLNGLPWAPPSLKK